MSRIGRMPITIPEKVKIEAKGNVIEVSGPLGKMVQVIPPGIVVKVDKSTAIVEKTDAAGEKGSSLHGLGRSLVYNAVVGVTQGFKKELEIVGLGYRAQMAGTKLSMTLGFAQPVIFEVPAGIKIAIDPKMTLLTITGIDAYLVGEVAARIRRIKKPEPYKGSGIKYVGEHIIRKAGKAAAGAAGGATGAGAGGAKK